MTIQVTQLPRRNQAVSVSKEAVIKIIPFEILGLFRRLWKRAIPGRWRARFGFFYFLSLYQAATSVHYIKSVLIS